MNSADLKNKLEQEYSLVCFEDLALVTSSYEFIYELLYRCRKDAFDSNERLVFYSNQVPDVDLLKHLQTALRDVDISNWFVLIVCPGDIKVDLDYVKTHHSYDEHSISQQSIKVDNGLLVESKSKYTRPDTVCPMPWTSIEIRANGDLTPCCVFDISTLRKKYSITNHSLDEFYHSDDMNELRKQLTSGEKPSGCRVCWFREKSGSESPRTQAVSLYGKSFKTQSLDNISLNRINNLDIDLGNLCNLKCRICDWKRSSAIASELVSKRKFHDVKIINQWNKDSKWITDSSSWDKLNFVVDSLTNLEFEGGEPFFYNWQLPWVHHLCDTGKSKNIRLRYSTNVTVFPEEQIQYWKKFRRIQLELSIDDIGCRAEYQRDGTIWKTIEENLKEYQRLKLSLDNLDISFFTVVSVQNLLYLPELLKYFQQFDWDIHLSLLEKPSWLSILNINEDAKKLVLSKFKNFSQTDPDLYSILSRIDQTVKNMTPGNPESTIQQIKELDQIREQSFLKTHPEIARALGY